MRVPYYRIIEKERSFYYNSGLIKYFNYNFFKLK